MVVSAPPLPGSLLIFAPPHHYHMQMTSLAFLLSSLHSLEISPLLNKYHWSRPAQLSTNVVLTPHPTSSFPFASLPRSAAVVPRAPGILVHAFEMLDGGGAYFACPVPRGSSVFVKWVLSKNSRTSNNVNGRPYHCRIHLPFNNNAYWVFPMCKEF